MSVSIKAEPSDVAIAGYLEISGADLADRDAIQQPVGRWLAIDGDRAVGLATAFIRPDDRLFITHRVTDETAFRPLLVAAVDGLGTKRPIHVTVEQKQHTRLAAASAAGFVPELTSTSYSVPFAAALQATVHRPSARLRLMPADRVDRDELFALDTDLRRAVPGSDGWHGRRRWFDDEMASVEFVAAAYPVAVDVETGDLVGLCRFWQNRPTPTLGMIGVRPAYRTGVPALALLNAGLRAASGWGATAFVTHTARTGLQRRLQRLGAEEVGGFVRLVLSSPRPASFR